MCIDMMNACWANVPTRPPPEAAILLSTYEFANANKLFCINLVTLRPEHDNDESAFSAFLSLCSYLFQNAHRSVRTSLYACLNLLMLQVLIEDQVVAKHICSSEGLHNVRLCRQRPPLLPIIRGDRIGATIIMDVLVGGINHNIRRRLDVELYL